MYVKKLKEGVELEEKTEKQRRVLELALNNPNLTQREIADRTDSSSSYVSNIHSDYLDKAVRPDSVSPADINQDLYEMLIAGIKMSEDVTRVERKHDLELSQGGSKEVDVAVWLEQAGHDFLADIECKFHDNPVEQDIVSSLIRDVQNSVADKGIVIAKNGFQRGAIEQARESNTELYILRELKEGDLDGRVAKVHGKVTANPIAVESIDVRVTPVDRDPPEEPTKFSITNPTLFTPNRRPAGETIWDRAQSETSRHGVGTHRIGIEDRLMLVEDEFYELDYIEMKVVEEESYTEEFRLNAYEDYDLYMKNALQPENVELYTIKEVLADFVEDSE